MVFFFFVSKTITIIHIFGIFFLQSTQKRLINSQLENFEIIDNDAPFKSRVTTVDWHPRRRNVVIVGSKHGDVVFYNVETRFFEETGRFDGVRTLC